MRVLLIDDPLRYTAIVHKFQISDFIHISPVVKERGRNTLKN